MSECVSGGLAEGVEGVVRSERQVREVRVSECVSGG